MIQPSARRDSGLIFPEIMAFPSVRQIDQPAGNAKNSALRKGFESCGIDPECCRKVLQRTLKQVQTGLSGRRQS
jgi:hypothetical protein